MCAAQIRTWCRQRISSSISSALLIIEAKMVLGELLNPVKKARITVRAFTKSSSSSLTEDRCFDKHSSEPMSFADFSGL